MYIYILAWTNYCMRNSMPGKTSQRCPKNIPKKTAPNWFHQTMTNYMTLILHQDTFHQNQPWPTWCLQLQFSRMLWCSRSWQHRTVNKQQKLYTTGWFTPETNIDPDPIKGDLGSIGSRMVSTSLCPWRLSSYQGVYHIRPFSVYQQSKMVDHTKISTHQWP